MKKNNVSVSVLAFFIINALIGCASSPAFEGKGDLCGLVVDENNKPVKDFVVYCKPVNEKFYSQPIRPVLTNASGLFVFYGLSSCEYLLSGSKNAYLKIEPVSYSFDDRTKIICIQTKSFKAAVLNAEELLKLGQKEEALMLLANVDCRDDSKEKDYINALKFYAVSGEEEKKEILTTLKKNKVMTNNENDFFYGYTEKLTEVMKWKESYVENN